MPSDVHPVPAGAAWIALAALAVLTLMASAEAAPRARPAASADEDGQWVAPPPQLQMDMDPTLVPVGRGAVFVPCMSQPLLEPPYVLRANGDEVGRAAVGTRIVAPPGDYEVVMGSGVGSQKIHRKVTILEGKTTLVQPDWSGLRIQIVDLNAVPFRGLYELIALPGMNNFGVGYGAQVEQGESVRTWLLEPGLYMVLKVGESYQARSNFFTFRVRPGFLEQIIVVMDADTGDFLGAGEMSIYSAASKLHEGLNLAGVVGGGIGLTSQDNVSGVPNATELTPSFYLDFLLQFSTPKHYVYGRVSGEEAFTQEDWGRFEKNTDFLRLDALYAWRLKPVLGPYVRFGFESTLFPGFLYFSTPTTVQLPNGTLEEEKSEVRMSDPFLPLTLKSGTGLRFNTPPSPWLTLWALVGVGGRYTFTGHMLSQEADLSATPNVMELGSVDSFFSYGLESTVVLQVILSRWVVANTEFELFSPFGSMDRAPDMRLDNNVALRVTSFVSVNYMYRMKFEPDLHPGYQHDHQVQLRFSYRFF